MYIQTRNPRAEPRQRAEPRRALPQDAADDGGEELRGRDKGHEAYRHERVGFADQPHISIAEQDNEDDGAAADRAQDAGQVLALGQMQAAEAQKERHDEIVGDHGGERDGLDNDHAGRGGQSADESEQGDRLVMLRHRHGEHERVRVDGVPRELQETAERDRQHEHIDQQEIEREQPDRLLDMPLVHVLDHEDLELPRQHDDRRHRDKRQRYPAGIAARGAEGEELLEGGIGGGAREHVAEAAVDAVGDEQTDGEESE